MAASYCESCPTGLFVANFDCYEPSEICSRRGQHKVNDATRFEDIKCKECPNGKYSFNITNDCELCPRGYFSGQRSILNDIIGENAIKTIDNVHLFYIEPYKMSNPKSVKIFNTASETRCSQQCYFYFEFERAGRASDPSGYRYTTSVCECVIDMPDDTGVDMPEITKYLHTIEYDNNKYTFESYTLDKLDVSHTYPFVKNTDPNNEVNIKIVNTGTNWTLTPKEFMFSSLKDPDQEEQWVTVTNYPVPSHNVFFPHIVHFTKDSPFYDEFEKERAFFKNIVDTTSDFTKERCAIECAKENAKIKSLGQVAIENKVI